MKEFQQYISLFTIAKVKWPAWFTIFFLCFCQACTSKSNPPPAVPAGITEQRVFPQLSFINPTTLLQLKSDDSRWYIAEKAGRIYYFDNLDTAATKTLYLDISARVDESFEGGLLGMAFDPDFDNNGFIYLSYTTSEFPEKDSSDKISSRLSRFSVTKGNKSIDPASELVLIALDQPWNNHNGGNIAFGPDGYLYLGFGDGGAWGDQKDNAQNTHTLFGAMLRLDVAPAKIRSAEPKPYAIPADNPFASSTDCDSGAGCPEIFAWGFRNPWRWSFDAETGQLWVGDVGQNKWEEIDLVEKGKNYGWRCFEGSEKYNFDNCSRSTEYAQPVATYDHLPFDKARDGMAASVTGGYIYRGKELNEYQGSYFFADFVHGLIFVIRHPYDTSPASEVLLDLDLNVVSFAQNNQHELYFLHYGENGAIYRLVKKQAQAN